jgi:hypothetical protein
MSRKKYQYIFQTIALFSGDRIARKFKTIMKIVPGQRFKVSQTV